MEVPVLIPTANPDQCAKTFEKWRDMGYFCVSLVDGPCYGDVGNAHRTFQISSWIGYPHAIKTMCDRIQDDVKVLVCAGDDMEPDPKKRADEIANEFLDHFPSTFGLMQPTGDPSGMDASGKSAAARICGSPWAGRDYWQRINGGQGLFWPGFAHYYADEEARCVAEILGAMWDRPDLCQIHNHWSFTGKPRPAYMEKAQAKWSEDQSLFFERKKNGFPGHLPK